MMFDKNIQAIVRNEDIPYKWLFSYGETHFQDLTGQELERIFPDLYRWTKVAFQESKSNALNMLFNLLWMDDRVNVLNWEYSSIQHYRSRIALRFQCEKEAGPITMLSFLHGERIVLEMLRKTLDGGILLFFEHPNTRDETVFCQMDLNTAAISESERKELLEILTDRIADKVELIDYLLSDKHKRENFFTVAESIEELVDDLDNEKPLSDMKDAAVPITELAVTQNNLVTKQDDSVLNQSMDNKATCEEGQIDRLDSLEKAIKGDGLLKMFLYLKDNVALEVRENAKEYIIRISAIYFVLQDEIAARKSSIATLKNDTLKKGKDWKINKKELGIALGIELITAKNKITDIHMQVVNEKLSQYEEDNKPW